MSSLSLAFSPLIQGTERMAWKRACHRFSALRRQLQLSAVRRSATSDLRREYVDDMPFCQQGHSMRGRPSTEIELSDQEEVDWQSLLRRRKTGQGIALRARIVLAYARGLNNIEVAAETGASKQTVSKWRHQTAS